MRISDWSSDVCSSDLLRLCRPRHQREDRARQNMPLHMFPFFFLRTVIGACDTEGPEQGPEGALPDDKYDLILLSHNTGDAATVARNRERRVPRQNQGSMFTPRRLVKGNPKGAAGGGTAE